MSDIDECSNKLHICSPKEVANCTDTAGAYYCTCGPGYTLSDNKRNCEACPVGKWGKNCRETCKCSTADDCSPVTGCKNCPSGYTGGSCDQDIDECIDDTLCKPYGKCKNERGK